MNNKRNIIIVLFSLLIVTINGQQLGPDTWTKVNHEVKQLTFTNESNLNTLKQLIFCKKEYGFLNDYKYFHLYVSEDNGNNILEFRLSNYPYKSKSLIGFFQLNEYLVFVHNELPSFLKTTSNKKKFSYTEHKLGNFIMMEDDTPCWIIEYKEDLFNLLFYPFMP